MNGGSLHPRRVSLLILLGLGTQVLMNVVFANYLHWTYPWDTFLFNSADRFNDFYHQARSYSADVIQPTNLCLPYFHLNVLGFHYVVRTLGVVPAFLSCLSLFVAVHWAWLWACLKRAGSNRLLCCVIIAFLNYPTLFAIDRGNTEVLVYALNVLIFLTFTKRWYGLSALLIGVGVNHKPFPIVFLLLLVRKRLWSRIALALGAAGLIFWISGMKAVALRQDYYYMYTNNMTINFDIGPWSSYYGHSLFIPFKLARALIVGKKFYYINRSNFYGFYGVLSALTLAGSGVLCWRRRVRLLDLLVLITMLESSLPWTTGDYTLLHLFLPLGVLLHRRRVARLDRVITCLLAVLLIPKHYFWFALTPLGQVVRMTNSGELNSIGVAWFGISTSGLISPIICLILLLCCLARPLIRGRGPSRALVGGGARRRRETARAETARAAVGNSRVVGKDSTTMTTIPFNKPFIAGKELFYIAQAVTFGNLGGDGWFTQRCCRLLEERFGVGKVLLVPSCTAALEMAALLFDLKPGDEVIVPSFTFVSTVNAFVRLGARPVFVDIRPDTLNLDEAQIERAITERTKAIFPVHYAGVGCEMDPILALARKYDLKVAEDAAQGVNAFYRGRALGSIAPLGCYSFHETKNFICGEGGALCLNDPEYIERAEIIRDKGTNRKQFFRGVVDKYTWVDVGSSFVPSELCSAFLYGQLEMLEAITERRREIYQYYFRDLRPLAAEGWVRLPWTPAECACNYHLFYLLLPDNAIRDGLLSHLHQNGVHAVFHYIPLHISPMGRTFGYREGDLPVTEAVSGQLLRLPFFFEITEEEQSRVVGLVRSYLSSLRSAPVSVCA